MRDPASGSVRHHDATSKRSILDVLTARRDLFDAMRARVVVKIDAALALRVRDRSLCEAWLPDTLWVAAWALVQSRCTGAREIALVEFQAPNFAAADTRVGEVALDDRFSSRSWVAAVDAARRTATADGGQGDARAPCRVEWCRCVGGAPSPPTNLPDAAALAMGWSDSPLPELFAEFDAQTALSSQVEALLDAVLCAAEELLDKPEAALPHISILRTGAGSPLPGLHGPSGKVDDGATTVHGVFARQAERHADAIAVSGQGVRLTYRELEALANETASALSAMGLRAGQTACVALDRSVHGIAVLLAILKLGAAYLPVDPAYPAQRLEFLLEDAGASIVVTQSAHRASFPASACVWLVDSLRDGRGGIGQPSDAVFDAPPADGDTLAYVMYTSGSTGTPKGIEICHRSILRLVVGAQYVDLSPAHSFLHAAPLGFDASTLEIWGPLLNGGRCVLHDEELPSGPGLARTIRTEGVTSAWLTAALFNAVVDDDARHLGGLGQLLIGGEALSLPHVRRALDALPGLTLINGYGPTECTTFTTTYRIPHGLDKALRSVPIGRPITDTQVHVLGPGGHVLPRGIVGELHVGGAGVARGYLRRPALTAERFVANPFDPAGGRLYRTGDLVRCLDDGNIEFVGRGDGQVKVRGFRIELSEIEAVLARHPAVKACAVAAHPAASGDLRLAAYAVASGTAVAAEALRNHLAALLPDFMVPATFSWLDSLPITPNGKLDRNALVPPSRERPEATHPYQAPQNPDERRVCDVFAAVLGLDRVGRLDNFFELGGNSLLVLRALAALEPGETRRLSSTVFFQRPTAEAIARGLAGQAQPDAVDARLAGRRRERDPSAQEPIAIIAMAGRFPGAADVEQFWENLCGAREGITFFTDAQLDASLAPALIGEPGYVKARGVIDDVEMFDAAFFGVWPKEAELMDPQQRIFLELCWECLERGGYAPDQCTEPVGVFAGMYNASYFLRHVMQRPDLIEKVGDFAVMLANEKDYIATRVANRLNLTGPAISVNTACSTSLVAIAQAFNSLRAGQCDMALAGGASVTCPPRSGYLYQEGAMLSPDGHTRTFDADAQGTVFSDGAAVVLLKRLSDAQADGDPIYAVVRGVAVNNDGRDKASFTAPSVNGQAAVVTAALESAGVDARSIAYVEAHGTATPMGDPVEVEALTRAYRRHTSDVGYCAIGSVKSNVGHMVIAAGAAGVIKTALSLAAECIPASLHYRAANPRIDFDASPFVVNGEMKPWPRGFGVRRAGVSSFGVGGTNAHAVLEEAPAMPASEAVDGPQLLQLSARSPAALLAATQRLATHLERHPDTHLADAAFTLRVGRTAFTHRACVVASSAAEAVDRLRAADSPWKCADATRDGPPALVFMFPGQGAQYGGMGRALYASEPVFREAFDECARLLDGVVAFDLRACMFGGDAEGLKETSVTQPATFVLEYALARTWLALGAAPSAMVGHSVGEFVAAVLAGVMSLHDAIRLVARRGELMQALPSGSMLSVRMPAERLIARLPAALSLAAENGPRACVVAGPAHDIAALQSELEAQGETTRLLQTSHAFHSSMMDPAVEPFEAEVRRVALRAPAIAIFSTVTGQRLSDAEATSPRYWARHLRETVRFSAAISAAMREAAFAVALEIGPRNVLTTLARQHLAMLPPGATALSTLTDRPDEEAASLRLAAGRLWALGAGVDLGRLSPRSRPRRVRLPTYPFERRRYWVEAAASAATAPVAPTAPRADVRGAAAPRPAPPVGPVAADHAAAALAAAPSSPSIPERTMSAAPVTSATDRKPLIVSRLRALFEDISGIEMADANAGAPFVELGLDSLSLTQVSLQIKKAFAVNVTFRQLMESSRTLESLATHLDEQLPPEPAPQPAPAVVTPSPAVATASAGMAPALLVPAPGLGISFAAGVAPSLVQRVIEQQMQLMAQQLALLGAGSSNGAATSPVTFAAELHEPAVAVAAAPVAPVAPTVVAAARADGSPSAATITSVTLADHDAPAAMMTYDVNKAFGAIARIHTSHGAEITDRQQARLEAFIRRYTARTAKSKAYTQAHRAHLADPRVVNGFKPQLKEMTYQIVIERTKGSRMWDLDGNEYVDVLSGFGMNLFGWGPDFVQQAVRRQLDLGYEIGPQHPLAGEVAKLVCEMTGFDRAGLCNTGSEAVMGAVRIARTITGRSLIVIFTGSYHGIFDEVIVRGTKKLRSVPAAPGILPNTSENVLVLDYGTPESLRIIRERAGEIAAVMVEPVQSRRPDFQPREFLQELREITREAGALYIFDEVVTGFRAHPRGAQGHFGIQADLASYGKVVGGGFPIGVIAGKREFMDALDGGHWQFGDDSIPTVGVTYFAGTFVRHPLALAAAKAVLEHLKAEGPALQEALSRATADMAREINAFCESVGAPIRVKHFASVWKTFFDEDHPLQDLLFAMMRSRSIHVLDNFPCFMTTAHTAEDIQRVVTAFKESVQELQEADFLPRRKAPMAVVFDSRKPPVDGARLGKDPEGKPAWFVRNPDNPEKFLKVSA
jgi:amino acid adenylation domain-containing protein